MTIFELVRVVLCTRKGELNPDGGIGGLTVDEEVELIEIQTSDLVNAPGRPCGCGGACCGSTPVDPHRRPGG